MTEARKRVCVSVFADMDLGYMVIFHPSIWHSGQCKPGNCRSVMLMFDL